MAMFIATRHHQKPLDLGRIHKKQQVTRNIRFLTEIGCITV